jgi:hypothetical protein
MQIIWLSAINGVEIQKYFGSLWALNKGEDNKLKDCF